MSGFWTKYLGSWELNYQNVIIFPVNITLIIKAQFSNTNTTY